MPSGMLGQSWRPQRCAKIRLSLIPTPSSHGYLVQHPQHCACALSLLRGQLILAEGPACNAFICKLICACDTAAANPTPCYITRG